MHSSTTAVLLLLALFGTSIVDACDEHAAQAMAFTLLTNVSTWNGATDMFGLTKNNFHVTLTPFGTFKTELQLDCCCDPGQDIGSPASVCETKCNSVDLNVWKKETAVINGVEVEFDFKDLGVSTPALLEMGSAKKRLGNKAKVKNDNIPTWDGGHRFRTRKKKGIRKYHREYGIKYADAPAGVSESGQAGEATLVAAATPYAGIEQRRRRLLQGSDSGS